MVRRLALTITVALLFVTFGAGGSFPQPRPVYGHATMAGPVAAPPEVTAEMAVVVDEATRQILYAKSAHKRVAPASLTKMVTAMLTVERGDLAERVRVDVDSEQLAAETASSVMGLMPGDEPTLEQLLYGLLLPSGGDAAIAIARHIAGTEEAFVALMNQKVQQMRLADTHFVNPHGLDADGHYSSAYDMALIARTAMRYPEIARIASTRKIRLEIPSGKAFQLYNSNPLLGEYRGADGVKTGYTDEAELAIAATARRQNRRLFVVVIRSEDLAMDATSLFDYYFSRPTFFSLRYAAVFPLQPYPPSRR